MTITLYNVQDDTRVLSKTLGTGVTFTGTLKENCSVVAPQILMEIDDGDLLDYNYAYIQEFDRYYYINEIEIESDTLFRIYLSVDVLMSYKTEIQALSVVVERSENLWNLYLQDPSRPTQQNVNTYLYEFPNSLNSFQYIMVTAGSSQNLV